MADKKYDFSAFDKPTSKQYDFSAFDKGDSRTPSSDDSGSALDTLGDAARGAASGATFGFNDEIAGGLGAAGDTLMGNLPQDNNKTLLERIVDSYKQNRDETRQLDKRAAARSPYAYAGGTLAGGILPGLLTGETSEAATAAQAAEGLKNASVAGNILKGAGTGLGYGALAGLGNSEADTLSGNLNDAAEGAKTGALVGGALQGAIETAKGVGKLVKGAGNTQLGKDLSDSFNLGRKGTDIVSTSGLDEAEENARNAAGKLGLGAESTRKAAGEELGQAKDAIRSSRKTFDVSDEVEKVKGLITNLKASDDPNAIKDVDFLQKYLDNLTLGKEQEIPVQFSKFTPGEEIQAKPSSKQALELEAAKAKASADALGQKLSTNIIPSEDVNGNKLLTLLKSTDENTGASERALPIKDENGNITGHDLDLGDGVNNKTTASAKTVLDNPAVEGGFAPSEQGPVMTEMQKSRLGGVDPTQVSLDKVQDIKNTLNGFNGVNGSPSLNTTEGINGIKQVAKSVSDKISSIPELAQGNKNYAASMQALEGLGLKPDDFIKDAGTGKITLDPGAKQRLNGLVRRMARDTDAGDNASEKLTNALRLMKEANPTIANALGPEVEQASRTLDLAQKANRLGLLNKSTYLKSGGVNVANRAGQAVSAIGQDVAPITNAVKNTAVNIGKSISNASSDEIKQVAQAVMNKGANGMKLASELAATLKKDNVGRNAALFAIQQNPGYREMLHEHTNDGQQK